MTTLQTSILFPQMDLTFADFFCGCGGLSLGFIKAGLKCISAMDIAPDALHSYWYNLCYNTWSHFWVNPENPNLEKMRSKGGRVWNNGQTQNFIFKDGVPDNWLSDIQGNPKFYIKESLRKLIGYQSWGLGENFVERDFKL